MSSTSVARKNRRLQKRTLPPLPAPRTSVSTIQSPHDDSERSSICPASEVTSSPNFESKSRILPEINRSFVNDETNNEDTRAADKERTLLSDGKKESLSSTQHALMISDVSSYPIAKVFIEEERGFKIVDSVQSLQSSNQNYLDKTRPKVQFAINLAYRTSEYFHVISNFCHGLLGGMSLLHCLVLYYLISFHKFNEQTIDHFSFLSKPVHNIFNFLCVICCVSMFDRYDIGNFRSFGKYIAKSKLKTTILLIYPLGLVFSLITANVDDQLSLHHLNESRWDSLTLSDIEDQLFYWKIFSLCKNGVAVIGWVIVVSDQNFNNFLRHLENIIQLCTTYS